MPEPSQPEIVLITGCSSGFGLHIATYLASRHYQVIATMRDINKKAPLLNELNKTGGTLDILAMDVTNRSTVKSTIKEIASRYGQIDVLINNAGIAVGGFFEDLSEEQIREAMEVNFFGVQTVTREVIPIMRSRKSGRIINISSVSGFSTASVTN